MSAASTTALPALDNTMGALFVGVFLAGVLWGISTMQFYEYFLLFYKSDHEFRWMKIMVTAIYLLDTADQVFMCHVLYSYLISNYGNPLFLTTLIWSFSVVVFLTTTVGLIVQLFFIWRVFKFSKHNPVSGLLLLLALGNFTVGFIYAGKSTSIKTFAELSRIDGYAKSMNALGAATDIAISLALVYWLQTAKSGIKRSDAVMNRLILFCLNTGILSTLCAILSLITNSTLPNTFIYMAFYCSLARIYTNSLLATLNARQRIRDAQQSGVSGFTLSTSTQVDFSTANQPPRHITITKDVETEMHYEMKSIESPV